ncbi:FAD-dependent monooxygenase [Neobacillus sp. LXY-4]|uniref:FAD-dependent monooxygenase n=1 Tax=Neobacillus sp. LXY-4 TaxID=3379826 RepID=UPI003EDEFCFA
MVINTDVVIVGAGPGGALLGYLLAKQNVNTVVLERNSKIDKEFRGEHLNEQGETVLKKHNLFQLIQEYGLLPMEWIEYWNQGKPFKTIIPSSGQEHLGIHVPQNHLLKVLTDEAKQFANYQLLMNTAVNGLIQDDAGKYVGVKAMCNGEEVIIHSSYVIAADGRFSTVRKLANVTAHSRKHGYDLLWAKISTPKGWDPTIRFAIVDGKQLALFTQAGGFIQIGWNINEGSYPEIRKQSFKPFIQQLINAFPALAAQVQQSIRSWDDFVPLSVFSSRLEKWVKNDSLIFIGDSAHTMTPTGAFGINSSLKDADELAEALLTIMDLKTNPSAYLKSFEKNRLQEMTLLQEQQLKMEAGFKENFIVMS